MTGSDGQKFTITHSPKARDHPFARCRINELTASGISECADPKQVLS
jgi:hypothetical protein